MGNRARGHVDAGDLGRELAALDLIESCEVARVLKQGPPETTELVRLPGEGTGTRGIRKTFEGDEGPGAAYRVLAKAQEEGRACDRLPRVRAVAEMGATRFVLLDYVEGTTLQKIVEAGPLAPLRALDVTIEICRAAEELHALPAGSLIHRDIKPSNVIVQGDCVTLIDLGIARVWRAGAERDTVRFGTPGFAPPEQYGYGQTSVESDVYAIGMVLAFCLLGKVPGQEERANGFAGLPADLRSLVARAASFDPSDRYPTAAAFRRALEDVRDARVAGDVRDERDAQDASDVRYALDVRAARETIDVRGASAPLGDPAPVTSTSAPVNRPSATSASAYADRPPATLAPAPADRPPASFPRRRAACGATRGIRDRLRAWCARPAARWLGCTWNVVLSVWFVFSLVVSVSVVVDPTTEADRALPLAARAVEYLGIMGPAQVFFWAPFVYKGSRKTAFPLVGRVSWLRGLARSWGLAALCLVATFVLLELLAPGTVVASG